MAASEAWKDVEDGLEGQGTVRGLRPGLMLEMLHARAGGWDAEDQVDGFTGCQGGNRLGTN